MGSILHTVFFFVVAISLLVAFHEYGHFWVARKVGVRVLRFSIGFGKVLWSWQKTPQTTQYVLSAIPLGGYVKMLDEREGPVEDQDLPYAFNRQPLWSRTLVVLAGPVFNLLLAVLLFWCVFMLGETGIRPLLGPVQSDTIAARAGFQQGEEIISVNDRSTPTWTEVLAVILSDAVTEENAPIDVVVKQTDGRGVHKSLIFDSDAARDPEQFIKKLGLVPWVPVLEPLLGKVIEGEAAAEAGLKTGDRIISADGRAIESWSQWVEYVRDHAGKAIDLLIERDGAYLHKSIVPASVETEQGTVGRIGAAVKIPEDILESMRVEYSLPPVQALTAACKRTYLYSLATLKVMASMLVGKASVDNLSGPLSIAQFAGQSASMGFVYFLKFVASVSVGLAIVNLLPIPVLDGGHLLFYAIEALKGSPVSEQTQIIFQNIGMLILLMLMGFAIFLDLGRIL